MIYLFTVGLISILGQVLLLRELSVAFYGVELIYLLALGIWMLCTAAGTWIRRSRRNPSYDQILVLLCLFSCLLPLDVAFIRAIRVIFAGVPGAYLPFPTQMLAMISALVGVGLILGLLFQLTAQRAILSGRSLAWAYAVESAGGIAGGLCATLLLKSGTQNFRIALICSLIAVLPPLAEGTRAMLRPILCLPGLLILGLIWAFPMAGELDRRMTSWTHPHLVETRDSPYCRVTVEHLGGQTSVFENDALSFESEGTEAEEFVHLTALQHPRPARVLILGGGIEGLTREILKHEPERVDYVELNPTLLQVVEPHLPAAFSDPLRAPNVRVLIADPRKMPVAATRYDLILVGMPEPSSGQANRFYTREFYGRCRERLNPGGIVGFRLRSLENYWTPQFTQRMVSIYEAARSVYTDVVVLPGSTNIVIGSEAPLTREPAVLVQRFMRRRIRASLVSPAYIDYVYNNDRFAEIARTLETRSAPVNTDARPICYQYTVMLWLSKFFPVLANTDFSGIAARGARPTLPMWALLAAATGAFLMVRRHEAARRALFMGTAGFLGMVMETLLILQYQIKNGVLYQDLGILLMSFMTGLTIGAMALSRKSAVQSARGKGTRLWGFGLILGFALPAAWIGYRCSGGADVGLAETSLLLALSGFLVAGVFGYASRGGQVEAANVIAPLYSADLIGGCLGSLAASLFFAPIIGFAVTAVWMVPVVLLAATLA